jgi:hypothetical protein
MVQSAKRLTTSTDRLVTHQKQIKEIYGLNRIRTIPRSVAFPHSSIGQAGGSVVGSGNFLRVSGGSMMGPFALGVPPDFTIEIDANNTINVGKNAEGDDQYTSNVQLDSIQPNSTTLTTIAGAAFDGQFLVLRTFAPTTPFTIAYHTLENGGNIQTPGDDDIQLKDLDIVLLVFDESLLYGANTGGNWRLINTFGSGSTPFSGKLSDLEIDTDKDWLKKSITNLAGIGFVDTGGVSRGSVTGSAIDSSLRIELPADGRIIAAEGALNILQIDDETGLKMLGSHVINMNNNIINTIHSLELKNGNTFTPTSNNVIGFDDNTNAMKYNVAIDSHAHHFQANGELLAAFSRIGSSEGLLSISGVTATNFVQANKKFFLGEFTNATITNGDIWINPTTKKFQFRENGSTVGIGGIKKLSELTIDVNKNWLLKGISNVGNMNGVGDILFTASASIIRPNTAGLLFNLVANKTYTFQVDEISILQIDNATGLKMIGSHVINMNNNIINSIKSLELKNGNTFTPGANNVIGFDDNGIDPSMKYNVALITDVHKFQAAGELLAAISRIGSSEGLLSISGVTATNFVQANKKFFLGEFTNASIANGDIWINPTTKKFQFRENGATVGLGSSGISFPIDFPEDNRGTVGASTQNIDFSATTRHSVKMEISGNVALAFSIPPTSETAYSNITIVQDSTGGHTVTLPAGTVNKDVVEAGILTDLNTETGIVIKYSFGSYYAFLETGNIVSGGSAGAGVTKLSELTIDVSKNWANFAITNLTGTSFVDTGQVQRGGITGDATTASLKITTEKLVISDSTTNILQVDDTTGLKMIGSHVINMNNNIINSIKSLELKNGNAFSPTTSNVIGFDDNGTDPSMKYNVASITDVHKFQAAGELLAAFSRVGSNEGLLSISNITAAKSVQANQKFFLGGFTNAAPASGDIWFDSATSEFKFREGLVTKGLGEGVQTPWTQDINGAEFDLGNFGVIESGASQVPNTGKIRLGNNELITWVDTTGNLITSLGVGTNNDLSVLGGDLSLQNNSIKAVNTLEGRVSQPLMINVPTAAQNLFIQYAGVSTYLFTPTSFSAPNIITDNTLTINSTVSYPSTNGMFSNVGNDLFIQIPTFSVSAVNTNPKLDLVRVDATPGSSDVLGDLRFVNLDGATKIPYGGVKSLIKDSSDSGILQMYARADNGLNTVGLQLEGDDSNNRTYLRVNAKVTTNLMFGVEGGGGDTFKIGVDSVGGSGGNTQLGFVVQDNVPYNVGTSGTVALPVENAQPPLSDAEMDAQFGNHIGACGMYVTTPTTVLFVMKAPNGHWYGNSWLRQTTIPT